MRCLTRISISLVALCALFLVTVFFLPACSKKQPETKEIKIGAILVLTGPDARSGQNARNGVEMVVEELNGKGGISGKKLRVIYEDDEGDPQKSVSAALKLITVDNVPAIIGPMWSTSVLAVAPLIEKNRRVLLSPTASAPKITYAGDYIFRNTYSDLYEGTKDAEYAYKQLGYRKAGIISVNLDAGIEIANVFSKRFLELGGTVVIKESYEAKTTDFRSLLAKFNEEPIDFIYVMGYSEMGQLIKQARELGIKYPFISTIMFEISDVIKIAGDAAEGTVYSFPSYDPEKGDETILTFAKKFKERYGVLPDPEAAFSYDAMKILCSVISEVGSDPVKIKNTLYQVKNYRGVTGETSFDQNGDVIKPIGFKKVEQGKYIWAVFEFKSKDKAKVGN
ncbi:MAG: ABC transporter substrate-binding protein [Sedimentisphaerales bacterium]